MSALAFALLATAATVAQEAPAKDASESTATGCAAFKWPLDKERKAFEDAGIENIASGTARGGWKEQAFALALQPDADVPHTLPPRKRKPDTFGAIVAFAAPDKAGTYQVTLSGEGWVDLVQQGAALKSAGHSGVKDCQGLRKSVRFSVGESPLVLQISGAPAGSIKISIRPVE